MGKNCSRQREPDTYTINRIGGDPGIRINPVGDICMIVAVTSRSLHHEGLRAGSIVTHVNGEKVVSVRHYQRYANPLRGSRFMIKVLPPEVTGTYKLRGASGNPGIFVNHALIVSGVDDAKFGEVINRKVEMINGVYLEDNFDSYLKLTMKPGTYFMTLSPALPIEAYRVCNAIKSFNQKLKIKPTEEVEDWARDLDHWKSILDSLEHSYDRDISIDTRELTFNTESEL